MYEVSEALMPSMALYTACAMAANKDGATYQMLLSALAVARPIEVATVYRLTDKQLKDQIQEQNAAGFVALVQQDLAGSGIGAKKSKKKSAPKSSSKK